MRSQPIKSVSARLQRGELTVTELVSECLSRMANSEGLGKAVITAAPDLAMARADILEAELRRGAWRGPLHGIPIVHKDNLDTREMRTTRGCAVFGAHMPKADAAVVARLDRLGAVVLGKAGMNELASGLSGTNEWLGPTLNPCAHPGRRGYDRGVRRGCPCHVAGSGPPRRGGRPCERTGTWADRGGKVLAGGRRGLVAH